VPNAPRLAQYRREAATGGLDSPAYRQAVTDARSSLRQVLEHIVRRDRLDALIGPTARPARLISEEAQPDTRGFRDLASLTGWPDLIVPAGFVTIPSLPVGLSFVGPPFSEARLFALGGAFERARPVRRVPPHTPALPGEHIEY
jgi:amidase